MDVTADRVKRMLMPPLYLALSAATFGLALHAKQHRSRLLYLPAFLTTASLSLTTSRDLRFSVALPALWSQAVALYILHVVSILYIERWPAPVAQVGIDASSGLSWRLETTYRLWGNPRMLRVSDHDRHNHASRATGSTRALTGFILIRLIKLALYGVIHLYILPFAVQESLSDITPRDLDYALLGRWDQADLRRLGIRAYFSISWIWDSFLYLDGANSLLALFFTSTSIDEPEDWPVLFGNPVASTSLRRFWSMFWHPLAARLCRKYGYLLAHSFLGLHPKSFAYKSTVAMVVFALAGATHAVVTWNCGRTDWHLDIAWFLLNYMGCTAEVLFMTLIHRLAKQFGLAVQLRKFKQSWIGSVCGYLWVLIFFLWSVPKWRYPRLHDEAVALKSQKFMARLAELSRKQRGKAGD